MPGFARRLRSTGRADEPRTDDQRGDDHRRSPCVDPRSDWQPTAISSNRPGSRRRRSVATHSARGRTSWHRRSACSRSVRRGLDRAADRCGAGSIGPQSATSFVAPVSRCVVPVLQLTPPPHSRSWTYVTKATPGPRWHNRWGCSLRRTEPLPEGPAKQPPRLGPGSRFSPRAPDQNLAIGVRAAVAVPSTQREDRLGPTLLAAQRRRRSQQAARSVGRCVAYGAGAVPAAEREQ